MLHICNCDPPAHCESLSKIKGFYLALSGNKVTTLDANANVNASVVTHFISLRRSASSNLVTSASSAMMRSGSAHNHQRQCMRVENRSEFAHFTTDFHEASFYVNLKACAINTENASWIYFVCLCDSHEHGQHGNDPARKPYVR